MELLPQTLTWDTQNDPVQAPVSSKQVLLLNAGVPGPITDEFDFNGWIKTPDGIDDFQLPLGVKVCKNALTEESNSQYSPDS